MIDTVSSPDRRTVPQQDLSRLSVAVAEFQQNLPDWWWSIACFGDASTASCGPARDGRDGRLVDREAFAAGFRCDDQDGDLADALRSAMLQGMAAREKYGKEPRNG